MVLVFLFACGKEKITTIRLPDTGAFDQIEMKNSFDVYLTEDSVFYVEVTGYEDHIDGVRCVVEDSVLKIYNDSRFRLVSPRKNTIRIDIHAKAVNQVTLEDCRFYTVGAVRNPEKFGLVLTGKANEANIEVDCPEFYYWNNFPCGGKVDVRGNVDLVRIWNTGITIVDAKGLSPDYAMIKTNSIGDCDITVSGLLEYWIEGEGNINLWGGAQIFDLGSTGSGKVVRK
jgi:hypothetical protein